MTKKDKPSLEFRESRVRPRFDRETREAAEAARFDRALSDVARAAESALNDESSVRRLRNYCLILWAPLVAAAGALASPLGFWVFGLAVILAAPVGASVFLARRWIIDWATGRGRDAMRHTKRDLAESAAHVIDLWSANRNRLQTYRARPNGEPLRQMGELAREHAVRAERLLDLRAAIFNLSERIALNERVVLVRDVFCVVLVATALLLGLTTGMAMGFQSPFDRESIDPMALASATALSGAFLAGAFFGGLVRRRVAGAIVSAALETTLTMHRDLEAETLAAAAASCDDLAGELNAWLRTARDGPQTRR